MRLPVAVGALIVTAIGGAVALSGELELSHPLHQAVVIAAALLTGLIGLYTTPAGHSSSVVTIPEGHGGPPYVIPDPLPVSSAAPAAQAGMGRAVVDAAARADAIARAYPVGDAAAGERGLP